MEANNGNMGYTIGLDFNRWKNNAENVLTYKEDMKRYLKKIRGIAPDKGGEANG